MVSHWTIETANEVLRTQGYIVNLGQVDSKLRYRLEKAVKAGKLAKWRAPWNAPLGGFGLTAKTIYGLPELNPHSREAA
jgi:hypothetical protein